RDFRARVHDELGELAGPRAELQDGPSLADAELAYEVGHGVVGVARSPALVVFDGDLEPAAGRGVDPIVAHAVAFAVRMPICSPGQARSFGFRLSPNTSSNRRVTIGAISSTVISRPASWARDATPSPASPHGTIATYHDRSVVQLSANPCSETRIRISRTPIAQTLRGPDHTPVCTSLRWSSTPTSAEARITTSSRSRTNRIASGRGPRSSTGYPMSCPGPWNVSEPPRSMNRSSAPAAAIRSSVHTMWSGCQRLPAV